MREELVSACYAGLGMAIVYQAIADYKESSKILPVAIANNKKRSIMFHEQRIKDCERFFHSERCKIFSGFSGQDILDHIDEIELPTGWRDVANFI